MYEYWLSLRRKIFLFAAIQYMAHLFPSVRILPKVVLSIAHASVLYKYRGGVA